MACNSLTFSTIYLIWCLLLSDIYAFQNDETNQIFNYSTRNTKAGHLRNDADGKPNHLQQSDLIVPLNPWEKVDIFKRAPNGFIGMRGKKQNEFNENYWKDILERTNSESLPTIWNAWLTATENCRRFKKAPTAFYGVRGKKFANGGNPYSNLQDLMQNLHAERLREVLLQDFIDNVILSPDYGNAVEKRTPVGFIGMRGKRAEEDDDVAVADDDGGDDTRHQTFKRSPPKQLGFYGTRGKKQPFVDYRNKFVGVRGRKSYYPPNPHNNNNYIPTTLSAVREK